jgi:hypothetical protein
MSMLIKEEQYVMFIGTDGHVLRVQELIWGIEPWPERFRVHIPASDEQNGITVYAPTSREAVELATEHLLACAPSQPSWGEYTASQRQPN